MQGRSPPTAFTSGETEAKREWLTADHPAAHQGTQALSPGLYDSKPNPWAAVPAEELNAGGTGARGHFKGTLGGWLWAPAPLAVRQDHWPHFPRLLALEDSFDSGRK